MVRVELQDADGKVVLGFGLDDCDPIFGDDVARTVEWKKNTDVGALAGKAIRLRFAMSDADLFAFKFN